MIRVLCWSRLKVLEDSRNKWGLSKAAQTNKYMPFIGHRYVFQGGNKGRIYQHIFVDIVKQVTYKECVKHGGNAETKESCVYRPGYRATRYHQATIDIYKSRYYHSYCYRRVTTKYCVTGYHSVPRKVEIHIQRLQISYLQVSGIHSIEFLLLYKSYMMSNYNRL